MTKSKKKPTKFSSMNKRTIGLTIFVGILILSVVWWHVSSVKFAIQLRNYPSAQLIYEHSSYAYANIKQEYLFYWISDDIVDVRDYFEEQSLSFFVPQDEHGDWLITRIISSESRLPEIDPLHNITHHTLCPNEFDRCVTVSLVDASQEHVLQTLAMLRYQYDGSQSDIPSSGTFIIFSYMRLDL